MQFNRNRLNPDLFYCTDRLERKPLVSNLIWRKVERPLRNFSPLPPQPQPCSLYLFIPSSVHTFPSLLIQSSFPQCWDGLFIQRELYKSCQHGRHEVPSKRYMKHVGKHPSQLRFCVTPWSVLQWWSGFSCFLCFQPGCWNKQKKKKSRTWKFNDGRCRA